MGTNPPKMSITLVCVVSYPLCLSHPFLTLLPLSCEQIAYLMGHQGFSMNTPGVLHILNARAFTYNKLHSGTTSLDNAVFSSLVAVPLGLTE